MIRKLKKHPSANCYIVEESDKEYFVSYRTEVLIIDRKAKTMEVTGLYSMTTRRQIGWYLMERFPYINYYTVKRAYEEGKRINIVTGELI